MTAALVLINGAYVAMMVYLLAFYFLREVRTVSKYAMNRLRMLSPSRRATSNLPITLEETEGLSASAISSAGSPPVFVATNSKPDLPSAIPEVDEEPSNSCV